MASEGEFYIDGFVLLNRIEQTGSAIQNNAVYIFLVRLDELNCLCAAKDLIIHCQ